LKNLDIQNGWGGWHAKLMADINSKVVQALGKWHKKKSMGLNVPVLGGGVGHAK